MNIPTALLLVSLVGIFTQWRDRQLRWIAARQEFAARYIGIESNMNRPDANVLMRPPWPLLPVFRMERARLHDGFGEKFMGANQP
jgi:hypothetical protein